MCIKDFNNKGEKRIIIALILGIIGSAFGFFILWIGLPLILISSLIMIYDFKKHIDSFK